jgi:hypothetical protein
MRPSRPTVTVVMRKNWISLFSRQVPKPFRCQYLTPKSLNNTLSNSRRAMKPSNHRALRMAFS